MTTRLLYDPNRQRPVPGNGAPRGGSKSVVEARNELAGYLDAHLHRPLYSSEIEAQSRVEQALDTMTQAERVYLEIDMQRVATVFHSSEYDPLK